MISLTSIDGSTTLDLDIVGYQFPDQSDNWCLLNLSVKQGSEHFDKVDPALETGDLNRLYHWFSALAENRLPEYANLSFTEPCLELAFLSYQNDVVRVAFILNCELKPHFPLKNEFGEEKDWRLVFALQKEDFNHILSSFRQWINAYPSRR
ncbi:WapI family immunity protein [Limnobaculum xujianqingii]|uniref:WapI family immunity protein n=1 Tax=Limnobaculum xujianqingii TaxID=2738837 RepID=UPI00112E4098|nr:hypothetical protein [Limnobaculum xujianqingii]